MDQFNINQTTVKWSPPTQPNGAITGYQVIYSVYTIPSTKMMSDVLDNTITEYSIENLSKYLKPTYVLTYSVKDMLF